MQREYVSGLVSIVTPVYNGRNYLPPFLESVLEQSYKKYEFIIVDDGSDDNSYKIIEEYRARFEKEGHRLVCVQQENKGQAEAINTGLRMCKGEYLVYPDADDILHRDYLSYLVDALQRNPKCSIALCSKTSAVSENDHEKVIYSFSRNFPEEDFFYDFVVGKDIDYAGCGKAMIRMECFDAVYPGREIYGGKGGQTWQMVLPFIKEKGDYIWVHHDLYKIVVHGNSHSRGAKSLAQADLQSERYIDILHHVLEHILSESEKRRYDIILEHKLLRYKVSNAYNFGNIGEYYIRYRNYKKCEKPNKEMKVMTMKKLVPLFSQAYGTYRKVVKKD